MYRLLFQHTRREMANHFKTQGCTPLARCGATTPGNWGRPPIIELGEQRKQRTSLK